MAAMLVREAHLVGLDGEAERVADVRLEGGLIAEVGRRLRSYGEPELDAAGCWLIPGLWDAHVHATQWVRSLGWIDVAGCAGPEQACARIATALAGRPDDGRLITAFGFRATAWPRAGTVAELDAATGARPVVVMSGDAHCGWLNSAALTRLGLPPRTGPLTENDWFAVAAQVNALPEAQPTLAELHAAVARLSARGLVGIVDMEFSDAYLAWPRRVSDGVRGLRVRASVYPHQLDEVIARGWRTGDALPGGDGLVTMGPLKIISDGSLGTRTAWCCAPYLGMAADDPHPCGAANYDHPTLATLLTRTREAGLAVAVHAIGDRANQVALDVLAEAGVTGSIEHAQLLRREDVARFAALGVTASVQPAHLIDDRDMANRVWADRTDRLFPVRSLLDAGARLALGSDAPVAEPDPWLAIAAAVHRSGDDRPAWHPEESVTPREALAASVDGQRLVPGAPGDLVLLGADPLWQGDSAAETAASLRSMPVRATIVAGRPTYLAMAGGAG
ncbi:MAG: amidohydrolase [Propioniciclava sp.]|uniref:amidohydrolase n=1 Tax=Propioniciclava sp. TaxID=2038686 RepID=UPI0039E3E9AF